MQEVKKILFPTDLSEISPRLVKYVFSIAQKFDAELHILFVARMLDYFASIYVTKAAITGFHDEVMHGADKKLKEFAKKHFKECSKCVTKVVQGDAGEEIIKYTTENDINMIMMGTHGRKGLDRIRFGSVAGMVVRNAPVPVMIMNPYLIPDS